MEDILQIYFDTCKKGKTKKKVIEKKGDNFNFVEFTEAALRDVTIILSISTLQKSSNL